MRKYFLILALLALPLIVFADAGLIGEVGQTPGGFCGGSELFCATFEIDNEITWDTITGLDTPQGAGETCPPVADNDWCDYDNTAPQPLFAEGSHGLSIQGGTGDYLGEAMASSESEFNLEFYTRSDDSGTVPMIRLWDTVGRYVLSIYEPGSNIQAIVDNADTFTGTTDLLANTTYHIGVHVKILATNGTVRLWLRTDTNAFEFGDLEINETAVTFGFSSDTADEIHFRGCGSTNVNYFNNTKVESGAPSWPTS